jgi:inner membrane protein
VNSWKRDYRVLKQVRWWAGPLLLATIALAFDAAKRKIPFGVWTTGPVDEVAHLCTAALGLLVLARFIAAPRRFYVATLIASVAIDLDHIPLYLGLLGNEGQRPVTHSLATVAVFAAAAVASRRHRAVLAGVAAGLMLHFARDIAEGYPGVLVFWPLQDISWMISYRWFVGMIVVLTAARLVLRSAGLRRTRIPVFGTPSPPGSILRAPDEPAASEAQPSRQMPKASEGDPRNHYADACESVKITSNYMANLGQDADGQRASDKGQFRT